MFSVPKRMKQQLTHQPIKNYAKLSKKVAICVFNLLTF